VGWLDKFPGRKPSGDPQALARISPGDSVEAGGETWSVTAVLFYRDVSSEWPVVKIERGVDSAWIALENGKIVRYDHIDMPVGPDGRANWQGRTYARSEMGNATVARVMGDVDVAVGDTLFVPLTASVPVQPPLAVHEEALVLDQVKVVDSPDVIDAVAAFNFAVGVGGGAAELTVIFVAD